MVMFTDSIKTLTQNLAEGRDYVHPSIFCHLGKSIDLVDSIVAQ